MKKRRGFCNHYRAMSEHATCEAGVEYAKFKGLSFDQRPCFFKDDPPAEKSTLCELAMYPTAEELAERDAWIKKRFENTGVARDAIVAFLGGPWKRGVKSASGQINCPVCGKENSLRFSRSGYNGHIHAGCTTSDCVTWME